MGFTNGHNMEIFKNIDPDGFHNKELTLHDCIADKIQFENHTLRFYPYLRYF